MLLASEVEGRIAATVTVSELGESQFASRYWLALRDCGLWLLESAQCGLARLHAALSRPLLARD
jgi:hypothetical protein